MRLDSAALAKGARYGTWSAANGKNTFVGRWTGVADTTRGTVTGTWTLADGQGKTLAFGGWAAVKAADRWTGSWRANVSGSTTEYSGAWTSSTDLKAKGQFGDMFERAATAIVSGTWGMGAQSGAWSIRAAPGK